MSEGEAVLTDTDNKVLTAVCKSGAKGGLTNEEVSQTPGTIWSFFTLVCLVPPAIIVYDSVIIIFNNAASMDLKS